MERHDDWQWKSAADDGYLLEDEHDTVKLLRKLRAAMKWLVLQEPPYTMRDPPELLQDEPSRDITLVAAESPIIRDLLTDISELENVLSKESDPAELGEYGVVTRHLGRRSFYRGFLDRRRTIPLLQRSSPDVIRFLERVPNLEIT